MPAPDIHISLNGAKMNPSYQVLSVDVCAEANRIPWAEVCLLDGDTAKRKFEISESGAFDLGTKIKISLTYVDKPSATGVVFEGIVTRHAVELDSRGGQLLRVECRHPALYMTQERRSATFAGKSDVKVIKELMTPYKGKVSLSASGLQATALPELVQFFATDWDFLLSRCQANGWLVLPDGANLKVTDGPVTQVPVPSANVMDFNMKEIHTIELALDGSEQYESAASTAWSFQNQALTAPNTQVGKKLSPGKLSPGAIQGLSAGATQQLFNGTAMKPAELQAWSEASINRTRLAFLRGRFEVDGNAKILPGQSCKISGIGTRFDGVAFITGVRQRISTATGWVTDVQVGLSAGSYFPEASATDAPAGGLLPHVNGLQVGVVKKYEEDKGGQYRVQVLLPAMGKDSNLIWARMAMPSAGKGEAGTRGILFWPEEGDEVIVGFLNDDPRAGIVLGSLYNSKNAPLYPGSSKNAKKGLVTKSGSKLEFDDEKQEILLCTKEKLQVKFQEKEQAFTITEKGAGATLKLSKTGIVMAFEGNKITISKEGILLNGGGNTLKMEKAGVTLESKAKLTMKAKAGAVLDGGPKAEIKGGMVELK
jgi:Rhs element Vgr protein